MVQSLPNIRVESNVYLDIYDTSGIDVGDPMIIENKSRYPVRLYEGDTIPSPTDTDGILLHPSMQIKIPTGSLKIWAICINKGMDGILSVKADKYSQILFNNAVAPGTSDTFQPNGSEGVVIIRGDDWTGVQVVLQMRSANDPSSRWRDMDNGTYTDDADFPLEKLTPDTLIQAVLTGAGAGDNIFVEIQQPVKE